MWKLTKVQMAASAEPNQRHSNPAALSNSTKLRSLVVTSAQVPSFAGWVFPGAANVTSALLISRVRRGTVSPWGGEETLELLLFPARLSGHWQPGAPTPATWSLLAPASLCRQVTPGSCNQRRRGRRWSCFLMGKY